MSRRVLVTGGSQGIGLAIARGCAADGHAVTVLSRRPPAEEHGLEHVACDLRDPAGVERILGDRVRSAPHPFDVLVHAAVAYGSDRRHPLTESTVEEWDAAMEVNARGLLLVLKLVLPAMVERESGIVIGLSSDVAEAPGPNRIPYAASKAAAHAVLAGLAAELDGTGIAVLELAPTAQVDTPGLRSRRPADFQPVGYAAPECFVPSMLQLLGGDARRHHGRCLWVDPAGRLLDSQQRPVQ